ncbi:thiol:disulfide interchange protein DsbA/DsbL [Vibrio sp. 99-8-1]|uniref:thiol:disulfide interchange protein DsbA/DsbL n=1 Tax=Vibrio sp. 99-8-1 TaxID=2607602 RepID=UPI001493A716|nr:thiol:disulfide interchange protein DsbA/DsbL [Vibrio sp. 99-8-1]NOI68198.1 thiol:disulfide interchange protein DsbA/DsbL [Vibrio sp. 99-8-1]
MKALLTVFTALVMSFSLQAATFTEGDYYTTLDNEPSATPTVTEYFSFYCPHCYKFEGVITELKKNIPDTAKFQKVHVAFMGNNMAVPMAKAYATMVVLKNEETMVPVMFKQIHDFQKAPRDEAELRQIFLDNGVTAKKFDAAYNGFAVDSMQKRFDQQFNSSTLTGVPGIVVNNKYVVKADKIKNYQEYFDLVNFLLKK